MKYEGGCHCGKVRFEVEMDLGPVLECSCSHCSKKGFLLAFAPIDAFTQTAGDTREYLFNTHRIRHQFCTVCGTEPFATGEGPDGQKMAAINARCIDGVDLGALQRQAYDGAAA
jgi:hypothetical protein